MRPPPFSVKLRRLLSRFGLAAFVLVFAISGLYETMQLKKRLATRMQAMAVSCQELIKERIVSHQRYLEELVARAPIDSLPRLRRYFTDNLPLLDPEDVYFVLNPAGEVVQASARAADFVGLDFSRLPLLRARQRFSPVHQSVATLRPVISVRYPFGRGWLLVVEKDLFTIAPLVRHLPVAGMIPHGRIFILANDGTVVYHPDERLVASRARLGFELTDWTRPDRLGLQRYRFQGSRYLCYRQPLDPPAGWVFYATMPMHAFTTLVVRRLAFQAVVLAGLFAGLLLLLQLVIRRTLSRPIGEMADQIAALNPLAAGENCCQPSSAGDTAELARIGEACARMAENIRRSNRQLAEREELFRTVSEFATDWAFWLGPDGRLVYVSPSCQAITGYAPEDFYDRPALLEEIIFVEDRRLWQEHLVGISGEEGHAPIEFRIVRKDGQLRWLSHVCRAIQDENGAFLGTRGSNTDITVAKQARAALAESEERLRTLMEYGADSFMVHDLDGRFMEVNPRACETLGYSRGELLRMRISDIDPDFSPERVRQICEGLGSGETVSVESRHRCKNGRLVPVEVRASLVHWAGKRLVFSVVRDISERKRAEEALAEEKELLAVTLRSIGDGVIATDTRGRVRLLSKVAEELTGWQQEEATGRPLAEVFRIVDARSGDPCLNPVDKVLASGSIVTLCDYTLLVGRDGSERLIADSGAPIRDRRSRIVGVVLVFRDITEQARLEEEAHKLERLESLGVLAGGIAHDFNNLLTGILGNISLAGLEAGKGSELARKLDAAEQAARRAQGLTQQLLTFAKGGAPIKEVTSLAGLVRESADFVLHGAKVDYQLAVAEDLWQVAVDSAQMHQVLNNLILNAKEAMPDGGTIHLRLDNRRLAVGEKPALADGAYVRLEVIDQGEGIGGDDLARIFDPYYTTKENGSGLGLASSFSIVKRHGGHLEVASRPGHGATFTVYLPALASAGDQGAGSPRPAPAAVRPAPTAAGRGRVLVMDDEPLVRDLTGAVLERLGFESAFAADGEEAVRLYRQAMASGRSFDLVIMDLTIPGGMGGEEAVKEVLALDPQAKVVVSSGYAQDPVMADYRRHGFVAVLAKPYSVAQLAGLLDALLGSAPSPAGGEKK